MTARNAGMAAVLALLLAATAGWWWTRPERQIHAILDDIAAALTHEGGDSGLQALAAAAAIEKHLAEDVAVDVGGERGIQGRDAVVTAAARLRSQTTAMRVRFLDPRITFADDAAASVTVTAEVTTGEAGADVVNVHQVTATIRQSNDRWVVASAHASPLPEPPS
jgi:hypothetical protein